MKNKLTSLDFSDNTKGKFIISPAQVNSEKLNNWVKNKEYEQYTIEKHRMHRHTRKRNKLYTFEHPILNKEIILKVSHIDKQYKLLRRLNLALSTLFVDYNFRAFSGGLLLQDIGINCPKPIMYWIETNSIFCRKSYYMYEKVEADHTLYSFSKLAIEQNRNATNEAYRPLAEKVIHIVKLIHNAGLRQGDPHPGNFLVSFTNSERENICEIDVERIDFTIIDLDKFNVAKPIGKTLKRFFDLRCLRRCTLGPYDQYDMLKLYLQHEYSNAWKLVVYFWIRGGFNPFKWFKKPKRGQ